jgi:serine phosphatase RsbU (regulator of sigma subunit)
VAAEVNVGAAPSANDISMSMVQLRISSAICVPLMLGATVAAFLYLDSRGTAVNMVRPGASAFCVALGKMASLALANLKRLEMERREALMRAELDAAAAAQKWIMPKRVGRFGPFSTIGESRPGQYVGGDFFDIIPLDENRVAVAVGDVCGKGIGASVLMTATQGFLHAALQESADPGVAVALANRYVNPRRPESKFVTLWVGVFDSRDGTLKYVDAGHSFALLHRGADGTVEQLSRGGGLPIGVEASAPYHAEVVNIAQGDKVMIVSDGIIEQPAGLVENPEGMTLSRVRPRFELDGVGRSLARAGSDEVADLFKEVVRHAGTEQLSDDATAVMVKWI